MRRNPRLPSRADDDGERVHVIAAGGSPRFPFTRVMPTTVLLRHFFPAWRISAAMRAVAVVLNACFVIPFAGMASIFVALDDVEQKNGWLIPLMAFSGLLNLAAISPHRRSVQLTGLRVVALLSNASFVIAGRQLWMTGDVAAYSLFVLSLFLFGLAGLNMITIVVSRSWHMEDTPICHECGYDLRGTGSLGCPECGWRRHGTSQD